MQLMSSHNVRTFGAVGDGKSNDTEAIQRAIDVCASAGGGTVYVPPGDYLTGTLTLKSYVTLHLSSGATLWGSRQSEGYGPLHLLFARDAEHVAIEGGGTIDGQGDAFWDPTMLHWGFKFSRHEVRPSPM